MAQVKYDNLPSLQGRIEQDLKQMQASVSHLEDELQAGATARSRMPHLIPVLQRQIAETHQRIAQRTKMLERAVNELSPNKSHGSPELSSLSQETPQSTHIEDAASRPDLGL